MLGINAVVYEIKKSTQSFLEEGLGFDVFNINRSRRTQCQLHLEEDLQSRDLLKVPGVAEAIQANVPVPAHAAK